MDSLNYLLFLNRISARLEELGIPQECITVPSINDVPVLMLYEPDRNFRIGCYNGLQVSTVNPVNGDTSTISTDNINTIVESLLKCFLNFCIHRDERSLYVLI